ncbi:FMRFamide receptor [Ischnura elegans]|uniref:FMRFamide receptor n=1 Tax=Ischnura elegans TaxID=197161 RepID=UPI001ED89F4E|nr:FMRFamide receptor [Ischnura elegans]
MWAASQGCSHAACAPKCIRHWTWFPELRSVAPRARPECSIQLPSADYSQPQQPSEPTTEDPVASDVVPKDPGAVLFEFITNGVLLCTVCALGLVGNALSVFILSRPAMRSSTNLLLGGLARCDAALLTTSLFLFGLPSLHEYQQHLRATRREAQLVATPHPAPPHLLTPPPDPPDPPPGPTVSPDLEYHAQQGGILFDYYYRLYPLLAPVLYPLALTAQTASAYLTLTVTLERWVAVCHPLKARSLCTLRRARIHVAIAMAFSLLYNLPRFWEVHMVKQTLFLTGPPPSNITIYELKASPLRADKTYISVYVNWSYLIVMYVLPFGGLAFLNAAIYRQVRKANRERQRLSRLQKKEIGLATMLLIVVLVFFLCNVLALVNNVLESFSGIIKDQLVKTSNLLVTVNSSVNFIIYVTFGERFRRLFLKMFCGKRRRRGSRCATATRFVPGGSRGGALGEAPACSLAGPDSIGGASVAGVDNGGGGSLAVPRRAEPDEESGDSTPTRAGAPDLLRRAPGSAGRKARIGRRKRCSMALVRIVSPQRRAANGGPLRKAKDGVPTFRVTDMDEMTAPNGSS